ncbi:ectonucleotide pyrophosphatase/phosphodiesterase [Mucilaginibacter sp. L196]|uniref:alkaline phosphatase family protein n=1 Tax=Mucilaginibacter sp. L196 TaxID=1641870 RepID=UPI00131BD23F|nr:ectonucleotide pyrophosphatase/phosphodiesterase [Mucilaginibacter sp. L196]
MKYYLSFLVFLLITSASFGQVDTTQKIIPDRTNSPEQQQKPYVILISADGFRWDYAQKYHAEHLLALAKSGVQAESMLPSYPSVTFPNHYSIVTGLYPSHEGLVNNSFYDADTKSFFSYKGKTGTDAIWYKGGTPIWVLAEQQKMLSASFYWVGSEAEVQGVRPTYYYRYNEKIEMHNRIQTVVNWLSMPADKRPHIITFYFPQVDHEGHKHGPDSREVADAVHLIDSSVYELTKAVKTTGLNVNYVFVSDHGMTKADTEHPIETPAGIDTSKFIVSGDGLLLELYAKDPKYIQATYDELLKNKTADYAVYLKTNVPEKLHYGAKDDWHNRIGDILLIPNWPKVFDLYHRKMDPGWHGYDPTVVKDMHATFYAWGPAFKSDLIIPAFNNVDIFPMINQILGLTYTNKVDGTKKLANEVLK